jgi:hypothetical protein
LQSENRENYWLDENRFMDTIRAVFAPAQVDLIKTIIAGLFKNPAVQFQV